MKLERYKEQRTIICLLKQVFLVLGCIFFSVTIANAQQSEDRIEDQSPNVETPVTNDSISEVETKTNPIQEELTQPEGPIQFLKYNTEQGVDSAYFNIIHITNTESEPIQGNLALTIPEGWNLIGSKRISISLTPGEEQYIPLRLAMDPGSKGGKTYVISAKIIDQTEKVLHKANCYLAIPKKADWKMEVPKRIIYFNQIQTQSSFKVYLKNLGNSLEQIKLEFEVGAFLQVSGLNLVDGKAVLFVHLAHNSDTNLTFEVSPVEKNKDDILGWNDHSIKLTASNIDKSESTNIWFKTLENEHRNNRKQENAPLNIQLMGQNLLSTFNPMVLAQIWGHVLLPEQRDVKYFIALRNLTHNPSSIYTHGGNIWRQSLMRAFYRSERLNAGVGDISIGLDQIGLGRGANVDYEFIDGQRVNVGAVSNPRIHMNSAHIGFQNRVSNSVTLLSDLIHTDDVFNQIKMSTAALGVNARVHNHHHVRAIVGYSERSHNYTDSTFAINDTTFVQTDEPDTSFNGVGGSLNYSGTMGKLNVSLMGRYGSAYHAGLFSGRTDITSQVTYQLKPTYQLQVQYFRFDMNPRRYIRGQLVNFDHIIFDNLNLWQNVTINRGINISFGPSLFKQSTQIFDFIEEQKTSFSTFSYKLYGRLTSRSGRYNTVSPVILMGYTTTLKSDSNAFGGIENISLRSKPYFNASIGLNVRQRYWGFNIYYLYGPQQINDQSAYVYGGMFNKSVQIRPFFEKSFKNDKIIFRSYNSYIFSTNSSTENLSISAMFQYNLKKGWSLLFNNIMNVYSRIDSDGEKISSRNYNLTAGFIKKFNRMQQPAIKYYDLKIIYFQDLNGDQVYTDEEPLLSNIMAVIEPEVNDSINTMPLQTNFSDVNLSSDEYGQVNFIDLPAGSYTINSTPLFNMQDLYNVKGKSLPVQLMNHMTLYVPFTESYKITGHISVQKAEYTQVGQVNLANVRVSAKDENGNTFYALTDKNGFFVIYLPEIKGFYNVSVNNIFGANFEIDENEYLVQFNNSKVVDISFVFKERKREIKFRNNE